MKAIDIDKLTLGWRCFLQHKALGADDVCKLLAELFDLHLACIFSQTKHGNTISFFRVGYSSEDKAEIPHEILFVELPNQCQEFWNGPEQIAGIHSPDDKKTIQDLSDKLGAPGIKQFGLLKFNWRDDKEKPCLLIIGVHTKLMTSDVEPFFTRHNIAHIQWSVQVVTGYVYGKDSEFRDRLKNIRRDQAKGSRTVLKKAVKEILQDKFKGSLEAEVQRSPWLTDYIWSTYFDMKTALDILPGKETRDKGDTDFEDDAPLECLTMLAKWRWDCWNQNDLELSKYNKIIQEIDEKGVQCDPSIQDIKRFLDLPQDPLLPEQVVKQCQQFVSEKWSDIELIRTQFFCLHHTAGHIHPVWGRASVKKLQKILFERVLCKNLITRAQELIEDFLVLWQKDNERLIITSDWLAAWFGLKLLKSRLLKKKIQDEIYSPNELAQLYKHLGCCFLYIFHWVRNAGNAAFKFSDVEGGYEDVIESTLYLLSEYACVDLELPRSAKLYDALMDMWASEAVLYTVHDTYREHLHHAVDVCLIGLLLIDSGLLKEVSKSKPRDIKDLRNWVLAALLHDVGYGLNLNRLVIDRLRFLEHAQPLKDYLKNLKNTLDSQEDDLCKEIQRWLPSHQIRKIDHGVISAMFTCHLNKTSPDSVNKAWVEDIQPALRAIIRHNLPEDRIDPKNEPLSFLLFLCDHLQEWDRPRVDKRFRYYLSAHLLRGPGSLPCTTTLIRHLKTNLCWNEKDKKWDLPDYDLKFELVFKDAHKESFEPAIVWCCQSFDLQKIRRDQLSRNISLAFVHPLSEELSRVSDKGDLTEMDLFQDFVMETGLEAAFSVWLHSIRKKRCDHLSHEYDTKTKEERFAVTLIKGQKSKETSVIPFLPSGLYEKFLSWKKERIQTIELRGTSK
ncbi:MAG: hypothetical protein KAJ90_04405 [Desulfobacterales bacterium]|nr:hypothetical protein [Desulfobacterales bacterium]